MTTYTEILSQASKTVNLLGGRSAQEDEIYRRSAIISSILLNRDVSPYDVAIVALADRLARMPEAPAADATYSNIAAVAAYAGQMAKTQNLSDIAVEMKAQIQLANEQSPAGLSFLKKKDNPDDTSAS
jgi:hypothetical protein